MNQAALAAAFEKAATLRDYLENLTWLDRRLTALRIAEKNLNGVLQIESCQNKTTWMVLKGGKIVMSALQPRCSERASAAFKRLTKIANQSNQLPETLLEMNLQLIVSVWFRKHPELKNQIISFDSALELCEKEMKTPFRQIA